MELKKQSFGVIIATRNIFNFKLAVDARTKVLDKLSKMGFDTVILPGEDTPTGNIEGYADAVKCADLFRKNSDVIEGIVVVLPNFGDELGVVNSIKMSGLKVPVLVVAVDDDNDKVDVKSRRDAFCGKLSVCNNFYQYGIKFTDTIYHTYSLDSAEFTKDILKFAGICRVVNGMKGLRVGAIGTRPIGFQTMRFSEKLLQLSDITIVPVEMSEIIAAAENIRENDPAVIETYVLTFNDLFDDNPITDCRYMLFTLGELEGDAWTKTLTVLSGISKALLYLVKTSQGNAGTIIGELFAFFGYDTGRFQ